MCTTANDDTRTRPSRCPSLASIRPCTLRAAAAGHSRRREQLWDCSQLHLPCRRLHHLSGAGSGRGESHDRAAVAAATDAIHRAALCVVAPPGRFTRLTDELCGGRHSASRHGCCTRCISPSAVCTTANDDTRTRPSRCPSLASIRPCTLRAAAAGHSRRREQLWDCSQLHLPCRRLHHLSGAGSGRGESHDRAAVAAATDAIPRAALCAVALPGRFTRGTDAMRGQAPRKPPARPTSEHFARPGKTPRLPCRRSLLGAPCPGVSAPMPCQNNGMRHLDGGAIRRRQHAPRACASEYSARPRAG